MIARPEPEHRAKSSDQRTVDQDAEIEAAIRGGRSWIERGVGVAHRGPPGARAYASGARAPKVRAYRGTRAARDARSRTAPRSGRARACPGHRARELRRRLS